MKRDYQYKPCEKILLYALYMSQPTLSTGQVSCLFNCMYLMTIKDHCTRWYGLFANDHSWKKKNQHKIHWYESAQSLNFASTSHGQTGLKKNTFIFKSRFLIPSNPLFSQATTIRILGRLSTPHFMHWNLISFGERNEARLTESPARLNLLTKLARLARN